MKYAFRTFDRLERACQAVQIDVSSFVHGAQTEADAQYDSPDRLKLLLSAILADDEPLRDYGGPDLETVAAFAAAKFFEECREDIRRANDRLMPLLKRTGVGALLKGHQPEKLDRILGALSIDAETHLRCELSLEDMLYRLSVRSISYVVKNPREFLH